MTKQIGDLTPKKDWQKELNSAQKALESTDQEMYPKLYETRKQLVDTLQYNENMRVRAEKAEATAKAGEKTPKNQEEKTSKNQGDSEAPITSNLSLKDIRALNDVHDDDVDSIMDLAKYKGIPVAEAKKDPYIQNYLKTREEERKTAEASNTGGSRKTSSKSSAKDLLRKVQSNIDDMPESDEEMEALVDEELKQQSLKK